MKLNPVSFKGIYDIRFPQGTKPEYIDEKFIQADNFIKENLTAPDGTSFYNVRLLDGFDCNKSDSKLADKGIRVSCPVDNPWQLCSLFDSIDKNLSQEYVNKAKVELILDTQA